ncbi:MAG: RNA polymerase sigma factor [Acidimicrobiales bacterium]
MASDRSDGFEAFYRSQYRVLVRALTVACGDANMAGETADEAFVRALERWPRVAVMSSPGGWLYRVAFNLVARRGRRAEVERRMGWRAAMQESVPPAEPDLELWAAVGSLPLRMRQAVALRYILGLSEAEVASAMGTTTGSASATLTAARHNLKAKLRLCADPTEVVAHGGP